MSWISQMFGGGSSSSSSKPADSSGTTTPAATASSIAALGSTAGTADAPASPTFDASILERIAAAADALKKSEHAVDLINLAREQERSWQAKYAAQQATAASEMKEREKALAQTIEEERRRSMQFQSQQEQKKAEYEDKLARQRYSQQLEQQHEFNERERRLQDAAVARQEQERRRTLEYDNELRQRTEITRARIEAEGRIEQERKNRDIRDAQLMLQAEENRKTVLQSIQLAGRTVGNGVTEYLSDPSKMLATVGIVSALALGIYAARASTSVAAQQITRRLAKPPLIRETSRRSALLHPWASLKQLFARRSGDPLEGIILSPATTQRLRDVTLSTVSTRQNRAHYRHLMLYGPPGTGKTMFARRLAQQSGLDYAILAGGDVGPLGKDAVTEIHKVFDWAESSRKGLIIFVDEADAFLRKRGLSGDSRMTEDTRNALSTFLYRTGDPTNKFMLVFSTNEPTAIDGAVTDRVDEAVILELPGPAERAELLKKYFTEYIEQSGARGARQIVVDDAVKAVSMDAIAKGLEGFSGRQIAKLCAAWQATAHATPNNMLTMEILTRALKNHQEQLQTKDGWARVGLDKSSGVRYV